MIVDFTPVPALVGGTLIGLAASLLLGANGRVAGISGIWAGLAPPVDDDARWRWPFVGGLAAGAVLLAVLRPEVFAAPAGRSLAAVVAAGLLVGVGTRMGSGCTSGHGVCGLSRLSVRSFVAVLTFMAVGFAVASAIGFLLGGVA